jgi:excisionase family DNA binding protein
MTPSQVTHDTDRLLTSKEAADLLQISEQTLRVWRSTKRYMIPSIQVGRCVRYRRTDLIAWITANRQEC